jgi:DNA-binding transcriptional MerR regulator
MQSRELVKLYYRIGEVSDIVGVQPHVLRYWETEFRSIRPQKSSKGQRVYSRRDVEKLLRVKDLLKNQGFTIAGARKRLSDPEPESLPEPLLEPLPESASSSEPALLFEPTALSQSTAADSGAKSMRRVLLGLRRDLLEMLDQINNAPSPEPQISAPKGPAR